MRVSRRRGRDSLEAGVTVKQRGHSVIVLGALNSHERRTWEVRAVDGHPLQYPELWSRGAESLIFPKEAAVPYGKGPSF